MLASDCETNIAWNHFFSSLWSIGNRKLCSHVIFQCILHRTRLKWDWGDNSSHIKGVKETSGTSHFSSAGEWCQFFCDILHHRKERRCTAHCTTQKCANSLGTFVQLLLRRRSTHQGSSFVACFWDFESVIAGRASGAIKSHEIITFERGGESFTHQWLIHHRDK